MNKNQNSSRVTPEILQISSLVEYQSGSIVSRALIKKENGTITLFAFDEGESLSEHTAPFDAFVYIVDGEADITIDNDLYTLPSGKALILPANRPHAVKAVKRFKMLLVMIRS